MIARLAFYVVEAALLAGIAAGSLVLAANGLRRLGATLQVRFHWLWAALWLVLAVVGVVFGETVGPEFVLPYHFCFWLAIGSTALWLLSFAGRGSQPLRHELTGASEERES